MQYFHLFYTFWQPFFPFVISKTKYLYMCFWIFFNALLWCFRCLRRLQFYFSILNRNIFFINVLLWILFFNWQGGGHYLCQVLRLTRHLVIMFPTFCWLRCGLQSILFFFSLPFGEVHTIVGFSLCWNRVMSTVNCKLNQVSLS